MHQPQFYQARVLRWTDGDSVRMTAFRDEVQVIDIGFRNLVTNTIRVEQTEPFRLYGCNAPERGKPLYHEARNLALSLAPVGSVADVETYKPRPEDKYGRWLVNILLPGGGTVSQRLIDAGLAVPYFGGARAEPLGIERLAGLEG